VLEPPVEVLCHSHPAGGGTDTFVRLRHELGENPLDILLGTPDRAFFLLDAVRLRVTPEKDAHLPSAITVAPERSAHGHLFLVRQQDVCSENLPLVCVVGPFDRSQHD